MSALPPPESHVVTTHKTVWRCFGPGCELHHTSAARALGCSYRRRADNAPNAERDRKILADVEAGDKYQREIAAEHGLSVERVRQIAAKQRRLAGREPPLPDELPALWRDQLAWECGISWELAHTVTQAMVAQCLTPELVPQIPNVGKVGVAHIMAWMRRAGFWL